MTTFPFLDIISITETNAGAVVAVDMDIETMKRFAAIGILQTWREAAADVIETAERKKSSKRKVAKKPNLKTKRKAA